MPEIKNKQELYNYYRAHGGVATDKSSVYEKNYLSSIGGKGGLPQVPSGKRTPGQNLLGNAIAYLLYQIASNQGGNWTTQQQQAARIAFGKSYIRALGATPQENWGYLQHPGLTDYEVQYLQGIFPMLYARKINPPHPIHPETPLSVRWARAEKAVGGIFNKFDAIRNWYASQPESSRHFQGSLPMYLAAGGWTTDYRYIANHPEYAETLYDEHPGIFWRALNSLVDTTTGQLRYGGYDENTRAKWQRAVDAMMAIAEQRRRRLPGTIQEGDWTTILANNQPRWMNYLNPTPSYTPLRY